MKNLNSNFLNFLKNLGSNVLKKAKMKKFQKIVKTLGLPILLLDLWMRLIMCIMLISFPGSKENVFLTSASAAARKIMNNLRRNISLRNGHKLVLLKSLTILSGIILATPMPASA